MNATLRLDSENHRYVFEAPDFSLRVAISHLVKNIESVVSNENGIIELVCDGEEEFIELNYLVSKMGIYWDFSKYNIEVII